MRRLSVAFVALAFLLPARVSAQLFTWDYLCAMGSVEACAHFSLALSYDPTPQSIGGSFLINEGVTRATFSIRNLQGASASLPNDPWQFTRFQLTGLTTTWSTVMPGGSGSGYLLFDRLFGFPSVGSSFGSTLTANRPVQQVMGNTQLGPEEWEVFGERGGSLGGGYYAGSIFGNALNDYGGLFGCDTPDPSNGWAGYHGGCETTFAFSMVLPGQWSASALPGLSWSGRHATSGVFRCTVGVDCVSVPEPSSLLLLAAGLIGFAVARSRGDRAGADD